jgi:UDP-arabinose 4-epimerase
LSKTVLVTGGAGFVGSHACKALARSGYEPVTFDNLERGHASAVRWGPLERGDARNYEDLRRAFLNWKPFAVMHFAAYAYVGESNAEPLKYYENNVGGTGNLARACVEFGCESFIFSSSCATYGIPASLPVSEEEPLSPVNPYGRSKWFGEQLLRDAETAYGLRCVTLRYFNAAGADPDGEIGESHDPETHLIPLAIEAAMGRRPALELFGDDYPTADGTCVRDYVHVSDLANAHVAALAWLQSKGQSQAFNLCNERGSSIADVVRAVESVVGSPVPVHRRPRRPGDPSILIGRSAKARSLLDWRPEFPDLTRQIEHAWRWLARR